MKKTLAERISERLLILDKNPSSVALEAGLGRSAVRDILAGKAKKPQANTVAALARALECSVAYLMGETDDPLSRTADEFADFDPRLAQVWGRLEAGVYRERDNPAEVHEGDARQVLIYKDLRLKEKSVTVFEMGDNSLSGIQIVKGDLLTVAFHVLEDEVTLRDGMIVVCQYAPADPNIVETSARIVEIADGEVSLKFASEGYGGRTLTFPEPLEKEGGFFVGWDVSPAGKAYVVGVVVRVTRSAKVVM